MFACLLISVSLFVSSFVSLFFDYLYSDKCQNIDEDSENHQPSHGLERPKTLIRICALRVISASDYDCQRFYIPRTINLMILLFVVHKIDKTKSCGA